MAEGSRQTGSGVNGDTLLAFVLAVPLLLWIQSHSLSTVGAWTLPVGLLFSCRMVLLGVLLLDGSAPTKAALCRSLRQKVCIASLKAALSLLQILLHF